MLWHFSSARDYCTVPKQCKTLFWMWCTTLCCAVCNAQSRGGLLFSILTVSGECNAGWLQCKKCSKSGDNPQLCKSEHCGAAVLKKWRQVCTQCKSEQKMQKVKKCKKYLCTAPTTIDNCAKVKSTVQLCAKCCLELQSSFFVCMKSFKPWKSSSSLFKSCWCWHHHHQYFKMRQ